MFSWRFITALFIKLFSIDVGRVLVEKALVCFQYAFVGSSGIAGHCLLVRPGKRHKLPNDPAAVLKESVVSRRMMVPCRTSLLE